MKPIIAAVVAAIAMACAPAAQAPTPIVGNLEAVPDEDGGTLALVARVTVWEAPSLAPPCPATTDVR